MKKYLGIKVVSARPMTRDEAGKSGLVRNYNPTDENCPGYKVVYEDGYESWSPKVTFEEAYREIDGLGFGEAIEALKNGEKVARKGWNGKRMFLFLLPAGTIPKTAIHDPKLKEVLENNGSDSFEALASIRMKTADDKILTGWLASQTDILSEDWEIV
jgi:hypothetical protein